MVIHSIRVGYCKGSKIKANLGLRPGRACLKFLKGEEKNGKTVG